MEATPISAEWIERAAERGMDRLDRRLMANRLTQAEYDAAVREQNQWVKRQYRLLELAKPSA